MDEEERKIKLRAGKDALLAYQKKKGKKAKKKKGILEGNDSVASEGSFSEPPLLADSLSLSASTSMDTSGIGTGSQSNCTSPPHLNDREPVARGVTNNSPKLTHAVPLVSAGNSAFDNHGDGGLSGYELHSLDSNSANSLQHSLSTSIPSDSDSVNHSRPRANGECDLSGELAEKVAKLQEERNELEAELRTLRDSQQAAFEKGKQMMADHYQSQLLQAESTLRLREAEMERLRLAHAAELDRIAQQQLQLRDEELKEKDRKHAAHIARLTEQLSQKENMSGSYLLEDEEREADRIRQIKEKLKEMHQEEKEQLLLSHQQEKQLLIQEYERQKELVRLDCQRVLKENQHRLEEIANQQMAQLHAQYVAAHKQVTDVNEALKAKVGSLTSELADVRVAAECLEREKKLVEDKLDELCHSHSLEIQSMKQDSTDLEQRLLDWKNKADNLTVRLEQSSHDELVREDRERELASQRTTIESLENQIKRMQGEHAQAMERREESIKMVYSAELSSKQSTIEELENRLHGIKRQHSQDLDDLRKQHTEELEEVQSQHSSELSLLEDSMTEQLSSKASLEFAEAHMKEMQQQLNAYRNQETNHRSEVEAKKKQHLQEVEDLRKTLELQRARQLEDCERKHTEAVQLLQQQVQDLQSRLELQEASHDQLLESELEALRCTMQADLEKQLKLAETVHLQVQDEMRRSHDREMLEASKEAQQQQQSEIESLKEQLVSEKTKEVEELRVENQTALTHLKASLTATGEEALTEARQRVVDLEGRLRVGEDMAKENRKLQEQCQKFRTELTARLVDLSITESALNEQKKALEDSHAKVKELSDMISQLQQSEQELSKELDAQRKHLSQQLQEKEDELATHMAHNQSLQAQVLDLTTELEKERDRAKSDMVNSQKVASELSEQQRSEIQLVHSQLESAKQKYSSLMEEWKKKEQDSLMLQGELETTRESLAECESRWSAKYAKLAAQSSKEIQSLKQQVAEEASSLADTSQVLHEARERVTSLENQDGEQKAKIAGLTNRVRALETELTSMQKDKSDSEQRLAQTLEEVHRLQSVQKEGEGLRNEAEELQSHLHSLEDEHKTVCMERSELKDQVDMLQSQLPSLRDEVDVLKKATRDQEKVIADLKTQLTARENAFAQARKEFAEKLALADLKQQSLQNHMQESRKARDALSSMVNRKGDLERSLSRARQSLMDKLREKGHLEKELSFQRVELERRQSEKQRLEELLMEKNRFEQELKSQKEQLSTELENIEKRLKMHESDLSAGEQNNSSQSARERDGLFLLSEYVAAQRVEEGGDQQPSSLFNKNSASMDSLESEH